MFTCFAILFTIIGFALFAKTDFGWKHHLGGYFCLAAVVCWALVFISLGWRAWHWLWVYAP